MRKRIIKLSGLFWIFLAGLPFPAHATEDQVLVTVGPEEIRAYEVERAIASSPFATQFNTMNEDDQASLRGDMLRRIVSARLLGLEARRLGMDNSPTFRREVDNFRLGVLYRRYMDKLRGSIVIPDEVQAELKEKFRGNGEALEAARSAYVATRFRRLQADTLLKMKIDNHVRYYESRIRPGIKPETVLMEADNGLRITYGDLMDATMEGKKRLDQEQIKAIKNQLHGRGELLLVAAAAGRDGIKVDAEVADYIREKLPAMMLEKKAAEWVPNEQAMRTWFDQHRDVGRIPTRYHVGQLVVASREEAEAMRARILKGESLFALAGQFSIDPEGRKRNGDMGWITEGRGMPELVQTLDKLRDEEVSEVIATPKGFHLVMVLERRPGRQKSFKEVAARVRQMMINEKLPAYLGELERRYSVTWHLMDRSGGLPQSSPSSL